MSGGRQSMDLLNRHGRRAFLRDLFYRRRFNRLMWRDTFGRVLCWLSGEHCVYQTHENGETYTHCQCCCKWLVQDGYKWKAEP